VDGVVELLELALDVGLDRRVADVGVDLDAGDLAIAMGSRRLLR